MQFVMLLLDVCLTVLAVCCDAGKNDLAVFWFWGVIVCGRVYRALPDINRFAREQFQILCC